MRNYLDDGRRFDIVMKLFMEWASIEDLNLRKVETMIVQINLSTSQKILKFIISYFQE